MPGTWQMTGGGALGSFASHRPLMTPTLGEGRHHRPHFTEKMGLEHVPAAVKTQIKYSNSGLPTPRPGTPWIQHKPSSRAFTMLFDMYG